MTNTVNTVIIGGGILGCASAISTQKRLRKLNGNSNEKVCLIEKTVLSSGISARHSGIVRSANAVKKAAKLAKNETNIVSIPAWFLERERCAGISTMVVKDRKRNM